MDPHLCAGWRPHRPHLLALTRLPRCLPLILQRVRVRIWLYENPHTYIDGVIVGLDEFMNLVLKDATEVDVKKKTEASVGQIMLKGDNVTMVVAHQKDATRK